MAEDGESRGCSHSTRSTRIRNSSRHRSGSKSVNRRAASGTTFPTNQFKGDIEGVEETAPSKNVVTMARSELTEVIVAA